MVCTSAIRIQREEVGNVWGASQRLIASLETGLSCVACGYCEAHGAAPSNERGGE